MKIDRIRPKKNDNLQIIKDELEQYKKIKSPEI